MVEEGSCVCCNCMCDHLCVRGVSSACDLLPVSTVQCQYNDDLQYVERTSLFFVDRSVFVSTHMNANGVCVCVCVCGLCQLGTSRFCYMNCISGNIMESAA